MKKILFLTLMVFAVNKADAQGFKDKFARRLHHKEDRYKRTYRPPTALKIIGVSSICVGSIGGGFGFFMAIASESDSYLVIPEAGGALLLTGIGLLILDKCQHNHYRYAVIQPKRNEFGIAYNFR